MPLPQTYGPPQPPPPAKAQCTSERLPRPAGGLTPRPRNRRRSGQESGHVPDTCEARTKSPGTCPPEPTGTTAEALQHAGASCKPPGNPPLAETRAIVTRSAPARKGGASLHTVPTSGASGCNGQSPNSRPLRSGAPRESTMAPARGEKLQGGEGELELVYDPELEELAPKALAALLERLREQEGAAGAAAGDGRCDCCENCD